MSETVSIDHANSGTRLSGRSGCLHLRTVTTKLIDDRIDDMPSIFIPKMNMSAAGPGALMIEYGAYDTHVVSANPSHSSAAPTGFIQNAIAFSFGYAMSLYRTMIGTRMFPMPFATGSANRNNIVRP